MAPILLLAAACVATCPEGGAPGDDGNCYLATGDPATPTGTATGSTTGTSSAPPAGIAVGDPIVTINSYGVAHDESREVLEPTWIDDDHVLVATQRGFEICDADGITLREEPEFQSFWTAYDPTTRWGWLGTRFEGITPIDLSDPLDPQVKGRLFQWDWDSWNEDISAEDGLVLVSVLEEGAWLLDGQGEEIAVLPLDFATCGDLAPGRAVLGDGEDLVLYGLEDPTSPVELDRVPVAATPQAVDFDGRWAGVALGGAGVALYEVVDDALVLRGELEVSTTTYDVALDDTVLWVAGYDQTAVVLLDEHPVLLGEEPVVNFTTGIDARAGRAFVGDGYFTTLQELVPGVGGPEVDVPRVVWLPEGSTDPVVVEVQNPGVFTLHATVTVEGEFAVDQPELEVPPQADGWLTITPLEPVDRDGMLRLVTDDPDAPQVEVPLARASLQVGLPHPDFTLPGFVYPDDRLVDYTLSDELGRVVILVFFAHW